MCRISEFMCSLDFLCKASCRINAWEALVNVLMERLGRPLSNNIIYWPLP